MPSIESSDMPASRLEATIASTPNVPRPMSRGAGNVSRHATVEDHSMREFDLDFSLCHDSYPFTESQSLPDLMACIEFEALLSNDSNFGSDTTIDCFEMSDDHREFTTLNQKSLEGKISIYSSVKHRNSHWERKLLCFLIPRSPRDKPPTSYGCKTFMTSASVRALFSGFNIDSSFVKNMLGRPDYWAPDAQISLNQAGDLEAFEFSCQHPRWHLNIQGSPLSVYMKYVHSWNLTVYILAHKESDHSIDALKRLLKLSIERPQLVRALLDDPFHIHLMMSKLSFEASKCHVEKFRREMYSKMNQVEDHLQGIMETDRAKLGKLTAGLQRISQNADSHIANAEVAIMCAQGIQNAHKRLHNMLGIPQNAYESTSNATEYILSSLKKQKMWFINYKSRKDGAMSLVYNLVTQNDAENNLLIARDMRRDSSSMMLRRSRYEDVEK